MPATLADDLLGVRAVHLIGLDRVEATTEIAAEHPRCPTGVWSEEHPALPARAGLTTRAVRWAIQALRWDDSTVSALARQLGRGHLHRRPHPRPGRPGPRPPARRHPGPVCATRLRKQPGELLAGTTHAALDPFRGHADAVRTELPDDTVTVLDAFHVVRLASTAMGEVRRRTQQATRSGAGTATTRCTASGGC